MKKIFALTLSIIFSLTGCSEDEIKSKEFYMENNEARLKTLKYCNENPSKKNTDANCINAHHAKTQINKNIMSGEGVELDYSSATNTE